MLVGHDYDTLLQASHDELVDSIWCAPHLDNNWLAFVLVEVETARAGRLATVLQQDYSLKAYLTDSVRESKKLVKTLLEFA